MYCSPETRKSQESVSVVPFDGAPTPERILAKTTVPQEKKKYFSLFPMSIYLIQIFLKLPDEPENIYLVNGNEVLALVQVK